jgi:hypothetical protein
LPNHLKVIPFKPAGTFHAQWKFCDYVESGQDIDTWYEGLSEEGQDNFDSLLKTNANIPIPIHWQGCKMLQGKYKEYKLWEWCFFADNRQQRLVGIFADTQREAVFVIGCYHKQKVYKPLNCLDTAIIRAKKVRLGGATLNAHPIPTDI